MKNWQQVKSLIKKHEGLSLSLYKCPSGKQTIGYGHNIEDRGVSEEVAELLLEQDTQIAYKQVRNAVKCFDTLKEARQYVLIDMCFNMGITKLMTFKKMLSALDKGDYKTASKEMLNSKWATQVKSRANYLACVMQSGIW